MVDRAKSVVDLVELRVPLDEAIRGLREWPWDSDVPLAVLTAADVRRVLETYRADGFDASDVERWADAVEAREDIEIEGNGLGEIVFELANPALGRTLTKERAEELLKGLA